MKVIEAKIRTLCSLWWNWFKRSCDAAVGHMTSLSVLLEAHGLSGQLPGMLSQ